MSSLNRKDGNYKVKLNGEWVVAKWVTNQDMDSSWSCWRIEGISPPEGSWGFSDKDFEEIDETFLSKATEFEIWSEGYVENGGRGRRMFHDKQEAESFEDACDISFKDNPYYTKNVSDGNVTLFYWGCRLFDNEADARKSFG